MLCFKGYCFVMDVCVVVFVFDCVVEEVVVIKLEVWFGCEDFYFLVGFWFIDIIGWC